MRVLGISPLDKDSTAAVVEDGRVLHASGEERFTRTKQQSGFPLLALESVLAQAGIKPEDLDQVSYPFLPWEQESKLIEASLADERAFIDGFETQGHARVLQEAYARVPERTETIQGLRHPNQRQHKGFPKHCFYRLAGATPLFSKPIAKFVSGRWARQAAACHKRYQTELEAGLADIGITAPVKRHEHHLSHAANAYFASGFERTLIVTFDGYGSGLAGSASLGEGGRIRRLHGLRFPHSLGSFFEAVTSSLGFHPDRHAGKVVGLAAYGDPRVLGDVLLSRSQNSNGDLKLLENLNVYFSRHLCAEFPMVDVAAGYQWALERWAASYVRHWLRETGCDHVVLSGGVTANVKMNQRIHELDDVRGIFIYPNMGDGGCGAGVAMHDSWPGGVLERIDHVYLGPSHSNTEIRRALDAHNLPFEEPANLAAHVAAKIHSGDVVARFSGAMEFGPRALGNRSILYHGREPGVNQWLNERLGRTEFMPFAPVTLAEAGSRCYHGLAGAEHTAEFMTITFDCTDYMKKHCPAAVHVDGTARPQLIRREINPGYYDIIAEYEKLSGIPCLINTSFNMHEEPIVCSPDDGIRAFLQGKIDGLAIGPFYVTHPEKV